MAPATSIDFRQSLRVLASKPARMLGRPVLLLIGDSRIKALRCASDLPGYAIVNMGVDGLTSNLLLARLETWTSSLMVDRAVVWIGVNDSVYHGRSTGEIVNDTLSILEVLAKRAKRVAVIAPIPVVPEVGRGGPFQIERRYAATVDAQAREVQQRVRRAMAFRGNLDNVDELTLLPMRIDSMSVEGYADPIHLNATGNMLLCALLRDWASTP